MKRYFKWIIIGIWIILLIGGCIMHTDTNMKKITISHIQRTFEVGGSVPITVTYTNQSNSQISFRDPEKTWEVQLMVNFKGQEKQVPFGRLFFYEEDGIEYTSIERAEEILLSPGEKHTFHVDAGKRWPELFPTGKCTVQIIDRSEDEITIESNTIEFNVLFSENSFVNLLNIASEESTSIDSKRFASDWINKFNPDFRIFIENPSENQKIENRKTIQNILRWWENNKKDHEVLEKISEFNNI